MQWEVSTDGGTTFGAISGATSTTYSFTSVSAENGYQFEAVFTNSAGSATSTAATLTVQTTPAVTTNPASQTIAAGSTVTFTAAASGNPTPTVQWELSTNQGTSFSAISGATSTTYSFTTASTENNYEYEAVFTNAAGSATSTAATLTVQTTPTVITNPTSQTIVAGNTVTFTAAASGNPTPTVQWEVSTNGGTSFSAISGATSTTYSFTTASTENNNQYEAVFTNALGSATSTAATLTVQAATAPTVTTNPTSQTIVSGNTVTFTAAASGDPTPTVQWEVSTDGGTTFSAISGATSTTYSITTTSTENNNQYEAVFTNVAGSATSTASHADGCLGHSFRIRQPGRWIGIRRTHRATAERGQPGEPEQCFRRGTGANRRRWVV